MPLTPFSHSSYMGEGMELSPTYQQDEWGRLYTSQPSYAAGEGMSEWVLSEPYSGIMGEGSPEQGSYVPVGPQYDPGTKKVEEILPEGFYSGNIDPSILATEVPGDARWDNTIKTLGVDYKPVQNASTYIDRQNFDKFSHYSTLEGDYGGQLYGRNGQITDFSRGESTSIWGADFNLTRDFLVGKLAPEVQATYEEVVSAAQQARDEYKATYGKWYTENVNPLLIIQKTWEKLAPMKGLEAKQLFDDKTIQEAALQVDKRYRALKKADDKPWYSEVMEALRVPAIFASLIFTGGAISGMLGTAGAGVTGIAGAADLGGIGGMAGADAVATLPASMGGAAGIDLATAVTTGYKVYSTVDKILNWDEGSGGGSASLPTHNAVSGNDVGGTAGTIEAIKQTAVNSGTTVANKVMEFFGGNNPFQSGNKQLKRLSSGGSVFGPNQGVIAEYDTYELQ